MVYCGGLVVLGCGAVAGRLGLVVLGRGAPAPAAGCAGTPDLTLYASTICLVMSLDPLAHNTGVCCALVSSTSVNLFWLE